MPRRFQDDDDRDPPRRRPAGVSKVTVLFAVLGALFVLGVLACGGLMLIGQRKLAREEAAAMAALTEAQRQAAEQRAPRFPNERADPGDDPDGLPAPADDKPVPQPPTQPPATKFDAPDDAGRWFVLFRGTDPANWNKTVSDGDQFAVPVRSAPAKTRYVRLRRLDTGEGMVVPLTRRSLASQAAAVGDGPRWNGEGRDEHGGRHLGIGHGKKAAFMQGKGLIAVVMDGWDATTGSGFGHAHHIDDGGQRQAWKGEEVKGVTFEIAVTAGELSEKERAQLLK